MQRLNYYQPGVTNRVETETLSGFGKPLALRIGRILETRLIYDTNGLLEATRTYASTNNGNSFTVPRNTESDFEWKPAGRKSSVQSFIEGKPYARYAQVTDEAGRVVTNGWHLIGGMEIFTVLHYDGNSERVVGSQTFQNKALRETARTLPPEKQPDGSFLLPILTTPVWGLSSTQRFLLGDALGRVLRRDYENGDKSEARSWYEGTACPRVIETVARQGRVKERSIRTLNAGTFAGVSCDKCGWNVSIHGSRAAARGMSSWCPIATWCSFQKRQGSGSSRTSPNRMTRRS